MTMAVASAPSKVILFGEHGVHRGVANINTAVELRTTCRVTARDDAGYSFTSGTRHETGTRERLLGFKAQVDALRERKAMDEIVAIIRSDFYAPARYVLGHIVTRQEGPGLDIEWKSALPIGSGMGSGAAANTAMARAAYAVFGQPLSAEDNIFFGWQGDAIAHGGYGSSLDSSTCVLGALIRYTLEEKAQRLPFTVNIPFVIGDTQVEHRTNETNTHIRLWLAENPARLHVFRDMGYLLDPFLRALEACDLRTIGHIFNLHQCLQVKMGVSIPESDRLIEAAIGAGAYGAKISGSGGGGIIIAIGEAEALPEIAAAIEAAGGRSYLVATGAEGVRLETPEVWSQIDG